MFARKVGLGGSVVSEIIGASIRRGMFDKEKYDKYHVLTSKGIQERYFEAVSRRKTLEVDYNILLVDVAKILPNAYISAKNVNIFSKNADIERQSKVEKSRVEKSKEEYILCAEPQAADAPPVISLPLNDGTFFDVSENDRAKWSQLYPNVDVLQQLRNMAGWCDANPSKRKTRNGIKRFITSWLAREQDKGRGPVAPAQQGKNVQPSGNNGWMKDFLKGG